MTNSQRAERILEQGARAPEAPTEVRRRPIAVRLADVQPERVSWLWGGRIPLGKVTVLDGDPSLGKSTLTTDLAARVTTGAPMPDGTRSDLTEPAGVVLVSAEDGAADTIRPRAEAAGADLARVCLLTDVEGHNDEGVPARVPWMMPRDLDMLRVQIETSAARLVVIDPLSAVLDSAVDSYRDQDVRGALRPLAEIATVTGASIVIVRHLSKSGGQNALYRGGGSIGIIGAARSGLLVARDPDDETGRTRILAVTKSNLAEMPSALRYELATVEEHGCARVRWLGETSHTASSLLAEPRSDEERTERDEAVEFLRDVLAGGPLSAKEVTAQALQAGVSARTLRRAKGQLGVKATKAGFSQGWVWELPAEGGQPPAPLSGGHLGHLRHDQGVCDDPADEDAEDVHSPAVATFVTLRAETDDADWLALCERIADLPDGDPAEDELRRLGYLERTDLTAEERAAVRRILDGPAVTAQAASVPATPPETPEDELAAVVGTIEPVGATSEPDDASAERCCAHFGWPHTPACVIKGCGCVRLEPALQVVP